ncbi:MAG: GH1 family beta-glucosidase [Actinomycetes bacterium]
MERSALDIAARLPKDFIFGAATASWQIEGDSAGRGSSIWDDFARTPGNIIDGTTADPACDHIHRWREDLDLLSWLGVDSYRFSVSWPRVQPDGMGGISEKGLDFYDKLIDELLARKIKPALTIYHWDLPSTLEAKGGWTWDGISDAFAKYTEILAERFSDRVDRWATFNEPWCSAFLGYAAKIHAPGAGNPARGLEAAYRLLLSHGRAVDVLRSNKAQNVGIVLNLTTVHGEPEVAEAVEHLDGIQNRIWLDPLAGRGIPKDVIARTSQITDWAFVKESELEEIATPIDWLGLNYYTPMRVAAPKNSQSSHSGVQSPAAYPGCPPVAFTPRGKLTSIGWEVDAPSFTQTLLTTAQRLPSVPIYVTENGGAFPDHIVEGKVNDLDRIDYFDQHINAALDAKDQGVDLRGYFAWSLLDNIEWAEGWTKRFGIFHLDVPTQVRTPKASAHFIREILAGRER